MKNVSHCNFCEHKQFDFTTGNICGLTQKKADFQRKCSKIVIGNDAKEHIAKINHDYKTVTDRKVDVIGHLVLFTIIGIAVLVADFFMTNYLYEVGWISTATIIGIAIGLSLIGYAFTPFYKYRDELTAAKSQKERLDSILQIYHHTYDLNYEDENPITAVTFRRTNPIVR